jgi:hypothetical protein
MPLEETLALTATVVVAELVGRQPLTLVMGLPERGVPTVVKRVIQELS